MSTDPVARMKECIKQIYDSDEIDDDMNVEAALEELIDWTENIDFAIGNAYLYETNSSVIETKNFFHLPSKINHTKKNNWEIYLQAQYAIMIPNIRRDRSGQTV